MKISEILANPHLNQLAAIIAVSMAPGWRINHPEVPSVRAKIEELFKLLKSSENAAIKAQFVSDFTSLLLKLVNADRKLSYRQEDLDWFLETLDNKDHSEAKMIVSFIFALASARQRWITSEQLAEITSDAASTWRNRAAAGEVIGAIKTDNGKMWIFNGLALRAYGINVPLPIEIEQVDSEDTCR